MTLTLTDCDTQIHRLRIQKEVLVQIKTRGRKRTQKGREREVKDREGKNKLQSVLSPTLFGDLSCSLHFPNQTHHTHSLLSEIIII